MCGIHGIVSIGGAGRPDAALLDRMGDVTRHRGPDDSGAYASGPAAIGMRRLSIIDVEGGHQPIAVPEHDLHAVCNGEIYNFRELRAELEGHGHVFRTRSDSEVVPHAYARFGDAFLERLGGMFGLAIWDERRRRLVLARDRLGIKPIYYWQSGDTLAFASEAKAFLELPGFRPEIDPAALHQYLALGYVPAPLSMFRDVRKLPPGHVLTVERGEVAIRSYWQLPDELDGSASERDWIDGLLGHLDRSVAAQMVSDVPIGAFLSGGIDSSSVVGLMARHGERAGTGPTKTYAIGFDTGGGAELYNELPWARKVSDLFGTAHREIVVRPNVAELVPKLLWHMDEPIADSAFVTTYLVAQFARRDVTVILSGVGGDELFGGYRRYLGEHYARWLGWLPRSVRQGVVAPLARRLPADRHSTLLNYSRLARSFLMSSAKDPDERYRAYVGVFDEDRLAKMLVEGPAGEHRLDALGEAFDAASRADALRTLFDVDLRTQLPDDLLLLTDKMTMATSLECRVPLLDHELVEFAATMPQRFKIRGRELKHILKRALGDLLPDEILYRKKRGFGAPMGAWVKNELAPLARRMLGRDSVVRRGLFSPDVVARTIADHDAGREDHTDHVLALLNLEVWCRVYLDRESPAELSREIEAEIPA